MSATADRIKKYRYLKRLHARMFLQRRAGTSILQAYLKIQHRHQDIHSTRNKFALRTTSLISQAMFGGTLLILWSKCLTPPTQPPTCVPRYFSGTSACHRQPCRAALGRNPDLGRPPMLNNEIIIPHGADAPALSKPKSRRCGCPTSHCKII